MGRLIALSWSILNPIFPHAELYRKAATGYNSWHGQLSAHSTSGTHYDGESARLTDQGYRARCDCTRYGELEWVHKNNFRI